MRIESQSGVPQGAPGAATKPATGH